MINSIRNTIQYNDERTGIVDCFDAMYVMDDFGNLIQVDWSLFDGYYQCA